MFDIQETSIAHNCTLLTQLYFPFIKRVQFATISPEEFWPSNQSNIVAVWHIKPKQLA